jgi:hypothetical protein
MTRHCEASRSIAVPASEDKGTPTKMSRAERLVTGLAVAILLTGLAAGGHAKAVSIDSHAHCAWRR